MLLFPQPPEPIYRVYDGIEFEVLPLANFESSPLCGTASEVLEASVTPEDEDHECRVIQAKHAVSCRRKMSRDKSGRYLPKSTE